MIFCPKNKAVLDISLPHTASIMRAGQLFFLLGFDFDHFYTFVAATRWAYMVWKAQFVALWAGYQLCCAQSVVAATAVTTPL